MMIHGADNTFDTLHEHETPWETHEIHETLQKTYKTLQTHKTHETHRSTALPKPRYSPRSSHHIDMADCTRKINQELTLLDNLIVTEPIVTEYCTAGAARQPTQHTTGEAKNPTKNITSAARRLNISMIGAAPFNHLVQKSQQNPKI